MRLIPISWPISWIAIIATALMGQSAAAEEPVALGGDIHAWGMNATISEPSARDAVLSGFSVDLAGKVDNDALAVGFDVLIDAAVGKDLSAGGVSVYVSQPVGEDLSASGMNVRIARDATIGGNARLAGANVVLDGPVAGSLIATAGSLTINSTITGDARLSAGRLVFGPNARIGGTLTYFAPQPATIVASVVPADRVHFAKYDFGGPMNIMRDGMWPQAPNLWPPYVGVFTGFIITVMFLLAVGALFLALVPAWVAELRLRAIDRPFWSMISGALGLATLIGLIPISALTLIGIPLIPVIVLAIATYWIVGYLLGIYAVSMRIAVAYRDLPATLAGRVIVLAIGLVVFAALNFIPFLGWLINLLVVFLGMGGMTRIALKRWQERQPVKESSPTKPPSPDAVI